jgi:hypothetical protein
MPPRALSSHVSPERLDLLTEKEFSSTVINQLGNRRKRPAQLPAPQRSAVDGRKVLVEWR